MSYTAFRLFLDLKSGIFERFESLPIARSSVLWAHVLTSMVANLISLAVVVVAALAFGFRSGAGGLAWLSVAGILALFTPAGSPSAATSGSLSPGASDCSFSPTPSPSGHTAAGRADRHGSARPHRD